MLPTTQISSKGWAGGAWRTLGVGGTQEALQHLQRLKLIEQPGRQGRQLTPANSSGRGGTTGQRQTAGVERRPTKPFARQLIWRVGLYIKGMTGDGNRNKMVLLEGDKHRFARRPEWPLEPPRNEKTQTNCVRCVLQYD